MRGPFAKSAQGKGEEGGGEEESGKRKVKIRTLEERKGAAPSFHLKSFVFATRLEPLIFLQMPKQLDRRRCKSSVTVVGGGEYLEVFADELPERFNPVGHIFATVAPAHHSYSCALSLNLASNKL